MANPKHNGDSPRPVISKVTKPAELLALHPLNPTRFRQVLYGPGDEYLTSWEVMNPTADYTIFAMRDFDRCVARVSKRRAPEEKELTLVTVAGEMRLLTYTGQGRFSETSTGEDVEVDAIEVVGVVCHLVHCDGGAKLSRTHHLIRDDVREWFNTPATERRAGLGETARSAIGRFDGALRFEREMIVAAATEISENEGFWNLDAYYKTALMQANTDGEKNIALLSLLARVYLSGVAAGAAA